MIDDNDFDRRLDDAFADRTASVRVSPPDIDDLLGRGQQRTRRTLAAATLGVLVVGTVGLSALASSSRTTPQDAVSDSLPAVDLMASTTVALGDSSWECDLTVSYDESCTSDGAISASPDMTTVVPVITVDLTTTPSAERDLVPVCTTPGCLTEYVVQDGDDPMKVADAFCTSVDELVATNNWADANEFPMAGAAISLPPDADYCVDQNVTTSAVVPDPTLTSPD